MQERRDSSRHDERGRVAVTILSSPLAPELEQETFYCSIGDVSASGLGFDAHTAVPCGAVLRLNVKLLEPAEEFPRTGIVVRCAGSWSELVFSCRIGVRLTDGKKETHSAWVEAVTRRLARLDHAANE